MGLTVVAYSVAVCLAARELISEYVIVDLYFWNQCIWLKNCIIIMGVCCSKDKVLDSHAMSQVWGCLNPEFFLCLLHPSPLTKSEFYECKKYQALIICQKSKLSEHLIYHHLYHPLFTGSDVLFCGCFHLRNGFLYTWQARKVLKTITIENISYNKSAQIWYHNELYRVFHLRCSCNYSSI
jgi:hypothetical protein